MTCVHVFSSYGSVLSNFCHTFPKELPWGATMGFLAGFKKANGTTTKSTPRAFLDLPAVWSSTSAAPDSSAEAGGKDTQRIGQEHKTQYLFSSCLVNSVIDIGYQRDTAYCTRF